MPARETQAVTKRKNTPRDRKPSRVDGASLPKSGSRHRRIICQFRDRLRTHTATVATSLAVDDAHMQSNQTDGRLQESSAQANTAAGDPPLATGVLPLAIPTPARQYTDKSIEDGDTKSVYPNDDKESPNAPPLPATSLPENQRVELQDQTNFLPFRQLLLVFAGLSMAMGCPMLDQTMYVLRFSC